MCGFSIFRRNFDVLKSKCLCFLLNKNISFNGKFSHQTNLVLHELKVKRWRVGSHKRKKQCTFVLQRFVLFEGNLFNPIQYGLFRAAHGWWGGCFLTLLPNDETWHSYTLPKKDPKNIYKSRDTSLEFYWDQNFFTRNQQILLHQEIQV